MQQHQQDMLGVPSMMAGALLQSHALTCLGVAKPDPLLPDPASAKSTSMFGMCVRPESDGAGLPDTCSMS